LALLGWLPQRRQTPPNPFQPNKTEIIIKKKIGLLFFCVYFPSAGGLKILRRLYFWYFFFLSSGEEREKNGGANLNGGREK
jgi:hypothetical protein